MIKLNIHNTQELMEFLTKENNSYAEFILSKLNRKSKNLGQERTQFHHIIPKHQNGPDAQWNLIRLTVEEHAQAHELLFENNQNYYDLGASQMLRGQLKQGWQTILKQSLDNRKNNKSDRFNSELQRELGSRPKKQRANYARNTYIVNALLRGFDLYHKGSKNLVKIGPCECHHMVAVVDKLMSHPFMENEREHWQRCDTKQNHPYLMGLTRLLTGHIDKKTQKKTFSYKDWCCLGINIIVE